MKYLRLIICLSCLISCNSSQIGKVDIEPVKIDTSNYKSLRPISTLENTGVENDGKIIKSYKKINMISQTSIHDQQVEYIFNNRTVFKLLDKDCDFTVELFDNSYLIFSQLLIDKDFGPSNRENFKRSKLFIFHADNDSGFCLNLENAIQLTFNKQILHINGILSDKDLDNNYIKLYCINDIDFESEKISLLGQNNKITEFKIDELDTLPIVCK